VASGLVAFGKVPGDDSAKMQGIVSVPAEAASCASDVTVALNGTVFTQTVSASTFQVKSKGRRCVYQRPKGGDGGIKKLDLDLGSGKFTVIVQDGVDLSSLTNPVTLAFEIGDLVASQTLQMTPTKGGWKYRP
jgi:hypothetical protein